MHLQKHIDSGQPAQSAQADYESKLFSFGKNVCISKDYSTSSLRLLLDQNGFLLFLSHAMTTLVYLDRGDARNPLCQRMCQLYPFINCSCFLWSVMIRDGLVVLGFNAILTAKVKSWRSKTHMCFLNRGSNSQQPGH